VLTPSRWATWRTESRAFRKLRAEKCFELKHWTQFGPSRRKNGAKAAGGKTVPKPAKRRRSAKLPTPVIARACQGWWMSADYLAAIHGRGRRFESCSAHQEHLLILLWFRS
jgi:hypothetical protein